MQGDRQNSGGRSQGFSGVRLARGRRAGKEGAALPAATEQMLAQPGTEKQVVICCLQPEPEPDPLPVGLPSHEIIS